MSRDSLRRQDQSKFRTFVLSLKYYNPSCTTSNTADFLEQSEKSPNITRHSLMNKINYLLKRGSIDDRRRAGRPQTSTTTEYQNSVLQEIQVKSNASVRSVSTILSQNGYETSPSSVYRAAKAMGLK